MSDKYSLLIMRDSTQKVRRLRISTQKVKILLISCLCTLLLTIIGVVFSFQSIKKYAALNSEISDLRAELVDANLKLESLQNVEVILKNSEEASRAQNPMDTGPSDNLESEKPAQSTNDLDNLNSQAVVATVFPNAVNATPAADSASTNSTTPENDTTANTTDANSDFAVAEALDSPAKVSNVDIRARSPKTVRLAFDLNNTTPGVTLAGAVRLALVTKDNRIIEVVVPKTDMIFQINYYKKMITAFPLPDGISLADVKSLRLKVSANGKDLQTETYPFPKEN